MIVPVLKQDAFIEYLKSKGFVIVDNKYWNDHDRIIFKKDGVTFPLQIQDKYFFPAVCRICNDFGISAPEDHQKCHDQIINYKKGKK